MDQISPTLLKMESKSDSNEQPKRGVRVASCSGYKSTYTYLFSYRKLQTTDHDQMTRPHKCSPKPPVAQSTS